MKRLQQQQGSALITALVILTLLTIIGIAATNTSTLETMIAATEKTHAQAFYAAEGGIEHLRRNFKNIFIEENAANIASGAGPNWSFALKGPDLISNTADDAQGKTYEEAAVWIENGDLGSRYTYKVHVWNNEDDGDAINDTDGIIFMRAEANVPGGGISAIEISLQGGASAGEPLSGYNAQEGGGAGKNYNANDVNAISDFSAQIQ